MKSIAVYPILGFNGNMQSLPIVWMNQEIRKSEIAVQVWDNHNYCSCLIRSDIAIEARQF